MYLIVGLGNPGKEYEKTRHNAGFDAVDCLADKLGISIGERKYRGFCGRGTAGAEKIVLLKPQTFMNASGESVRAAADFYKLSPERIIIVYDDVCLETGQLRIRAKGSAGGHNGIKSIIAHLGSQDFPRLKIGVGAGSGQADLVDHVLGRFSKEDRPVMEEAFRQAAGAVEMMIEDGLEAAMNRYNGRRKGQETR